ncbi:MAG: protein kinase [Thermoguttaceae bacterium]|nr:protein kinase [Thermoguttaceae bacterium]
MDPLVRETLENKGFRIGRRLGRGGFGEVYEAFSSEGVPCALKVSLDVLDEASSVVRKELENLAVVKQISTHPHLVTLIDYWVINNYLVTRWELSTEGSLLKYLQERAAQGQVGIPLDQLLRYMRDAAVAIDFLNREKGIYHRDIKPANLLLFHGRVKVSDLGFAKIAGASSVSNTLVGTIGYMPPEAHSRGILSKSVDLYGLAASYVKLRCGREPFGENISEVYERQKTGRVELSGLTFAEAQLVCAALAPNPEDRPQEGALTWVDQLCECLNVGSYRAVKGRASVRSRSQAEAATGPGGMLLRGHPSAVTCCSFSGSGRHLLSGHEDGNVVMWEVDPPRIVRSFLEHSDAIRCCSMSSDDRLALTAATDQTVILWEATVGQILRKWQPFPQEIVCCDFEPSSRRLVAGGSRGMMAICDFLTGETIARWSAGKEAIVACAFLPDGKGLLTLQRTGELAQWDLRTQLAGRSVRLTEEALTAGSFSRNLRRIVAIVADQRIKVWEISSKEVIWDIDCGKLMPLEVAISWDGGSVLVVFTDDSANIWDIDKKREVWRLAPIGIAAISCAFSPTGRSVAVGYQDGRLQVCPL